MLWTLVAFAADPQPRIKHIPADCEPMAREQGWIVLGRDVEFLPMFNPPRIASPQGDGDRGLDDGA